MTKKVLTLLDINSRGDYDVMALPQWVCDIVRKNQFSFSPDMYYRPTSGKAIAIGLLLDMFMFGHMHYMDSSFSTNSSFSLYQSEYQLVKYTIRFADPGGLTPSVQNIYEDLLRKTCGDSSKLHDWMDHNGYAGLSEEDQLVWRLKL